MTQPQLQETINELFRLWTNAADFVTLLRNSKVHFSMTLMNESIKRRDLYRKTYMHLQESSGMWPDDAVLRGEIERAA